MFRALLCSSSGGKIVLTQHLVSSLSLGDCTVHRLRQSSPNLCTVQSPKESDDTGCCTNTIFLLKVSYKLRECSRNLCTEQSPKESDDTRCCTNTICPPEDEHNSARNM